MRETHALLVSLVLAVVAVYFRLTPDVRIPGAQRISAAVCGVAVGLLIGTLIASAA